MKRRNFLSGLLAAPVALKARLAQFFERKPVELCNAPIVLCNAPMFTRVLNDRQPARDQVIIRNPQGRNHPRSLTARQREVVQLLAEGKSMKEVARVLNIAPRTARFHPASETLLHCSLPRGHKGPHVLLNPR